MKKKIFLPFIFIAFSVIYCYSQIPAFPGAQGFGSQTVGGRGGIVIKVTNLNDHGPGSLRAAIEVNEPRIIVFTVGGIIDLETELSVKNPFVTIAGQTAPGDGICLRGETLRIYAHDVIIRYIRSRPGDIDFGPSNAWDLIDAISIFGNAYNVIIDHCSLSWAVDENIEVWQRAHDVTIQNCIISQALNYSKHSKGSHGMGMIIGSRTTNISIHHNIFAHNNDRNPHINGPAIVDFRNNVIYNPGGMVTDVTAKNGQVVNYVNNYIKKGPNTNVSSDITIRNLSNQSAKFYVSGNVGIGNIFKESYYSDNRLLQQVKDSTQLMANLSEAYPTPSVSTQSALQAYEYLLQDAGAILPKRDAVDREIIKDIINKRGGMVNSKAHLLAWPPFQSGIPLLDSDEDGMPDHWEERYNLDPQVNDSAEDNDGDGYTNIEEFLNKTDPTQQEAATPSNFFPLSEESSRLATYPELNLKIEQNYPNPFSNETHIKFSIDKPSEIVIKVVDNEGKEIVELVNGFLYEGKYHVLWDSSNVNSGMYQILITSKDEVKGIKTILSR